MCTKGFIVLQHLTQTSPGLQFPQMPTPRQGSGVTLSIHGLWSGGPSDPEFLCDTSLPTGSLALQNRRVQIGPGAGRWDRVPPTSQNGGEDERALFIKPRSFPRLEGTQVSLLTVSNTFWGAKGRFPRGPSRT